MFFISNLNSRLLILKYVYQNYLNHHSFNQLNLLILLIFLLLLNIYILMLLFMLLTLLFYLHYHTIKYNIILNTFIYSNYSIYFYNFAI